MKYTIVNYDPDFDDSDEFREQQERNFNDWVEEQEQNEL